MRNTVDDLAAVPRPGPVAQFHRSISLLLELGIPTATLARLFQTSSDNIRQVRKRVHEEISPSPPLPATDLLRDYADEEEWERLRKKAVFSNKLRGRKRLESFENRLQSRFGECAKAEHFAVGALALRNFLPYVANAAHPEVLRLKALVNQHIAWLFVHDGQSENAIHYAREAMASALAAFDESLGDRRFLREYGEAALITSNAMLTAHRPDEALQVLAEADAAVLAREGKIGSEHYRQRATALFQKGEDEAALKRFQDARYAAEQTGDRNPIELQMTSDRQMNVIRPGKGIAHAFDLCEGAKQFFGPHSLEYVMTIHWAAAAAFLTDSDSEIKEAAKLLTEAAPAARQFGHQATTNFLLSITNGLNLPLPKRTSWIRFLLYENSARSK
jgi:tetratricopeptide (TPR) repeat protein